MQRFAISLGEIRRQGRLYGDSKEGKIVFRCCQSTTMCGNSIDRVISQNSTAKAV